MAVHGRGLVALLVLVSLVSIAEPLATSIAASSSSPGGRIITSGVLYDASGMNTLMACSNPVCVLVGDRVASFFYGAAPLSLLILPAPVRDLGISCSGGACVVGFQVADRVLVYQAVLSGGSFSLRYVETLGNASIVRSREDLLVYSNGTVYRYNPRSGDRNELASGLGFKPVTSPWPECFAGQGVAVYANKRVSNVTFASRTGVVVYREGNESVVWWRGGIDRVRGEVYVAGSFGRGVCVLYSKPGERSIVFRAVAPSGAGTPNVYEKELGPGDIVALVSWRDWCAVSVNDRLYVYRPGSGLARVADGYFPSLFGPTPIGVHASSIVLQKPLGGNTVSYLVVTPKGLYRVNGTAVPGAVSDCGDGMCAAYLPPSTYLFTSRERAEAYILDLSSLVPVEGGFLALGYDGKLYYFSGKGTQVLASCKSRCSMSVQGSAVLLLEENGDIHVVRAGGGEKVLSTGLEKPLKAALLSYSPAVVVASNKTHTALAAEGIGASAERGVPRTIYAYGSDRLEVAGAVLNTTKILVVSTATGKIESVDYSGLADSPNLPWTTLCSNGSVIAWSPGAKVFYTYPGGKAVETGNLTLVGVTNDCHILTTNGTALFIDGKPVCNTAPQFISWAFELPDGTVLVGAPPTTYVFRGGSCRDLEARITNPLDPGTRILVVRKDSILALSTFLAPTATITRLTGGGVSRIVYGKVLNADPVFENPEILALRDGSFVVADTSGGEQEIALPVPEQPYQAVLAPKGIIATYLIGMAAVKIYTSVVTPPGLGGETATETTTSIPSVTGITRTTSTAGELTTTTSSKYYFPTPTNTTTASGAPASTTTASLPPTTRPATTTTTTPQGTGLWLPLLVAGIIITLIGIILLIRARRR